MSRADAIPEVLRPHILPIDWDVREVWALEAPVRVVPIERVAYLLELPIWSSRPNAGMCFDCVPRAVLADPAHCPYQLQRLLRSDTRYPMDFVETRGAWWILDGVHRLARLVHEGATQVRVRVHAEAVLAHISPDPA